MKGMCLKTYSTIYRRCKNGARHIYGLVKFGSGIELSIFSDILAVQKQSRSTKELVGLTHPIGMLIECELSILV